jgi:hypothetical protein
MAQTAAPNNLKKKHDAPVVNREKLSAELDLLEKRLEELRMLYEQHFVDILPQAPDPLRKEVVRTIRQLLKAPFKNSQTRFRLRTLVTRYQTYSTYWERVLKEREEGRYVKDLFKVEMRAKMLEDAKKEATRSGKAEEGMKQLFSTYEEALRKVGASTDNLNFDSFKKSLVERAREIKKKHGVTKLHYKVVVKDGRVVLKANTDKG